MKNKDALDKLFVNCNKIDEGKAKVILSSKLSKNLSLKDWSWDIPADLAEISNRKDNKFKTFIGIGRWIVSKKQGNKFVCISYRGELIYLEKEIVRVLYNSLKEDGK